MNVYLVIAVYEDDFARFANEVTAENPAAAEALTLAEYPGLVVAGVIQLIDGAMQVVA